MRSRAGRRSAGWPRGCPRTANRLRSPTRRSSSSVGTVRRRRGCEVSAVSSRSIVSGVSSYRAEVAGGPRPGGRIPRWSIADGRSSVSSTPSRPISRHTSPVAASTATLLRRRGESCASGRDCRRAAEASAGRLPGRCRSTPTRRGCNPGRCRRSSGRSGRGCRSSRNRRPTAGWPG